MRPRRLLWIARVLLYRLRYRDAFAIEGFGLNVGKNVSVVVRPPGSLRIGRAVQLRDGCEIEALGGNVSIGPNVFFNRNCTVVAYEGVEIGADCIFGPNVGIYDHDHGFEAAGEPIWSQKPRVAPVSIGSNVWIGANVVVTAGVRIGERVVVGANSVVTRSLDSGGLYAGNPAAIVRRIGPDDG